MTIAFDENLRAIMYLSGDGQDWMLGLSEHPDRIEVNYRFRYYSPDSTNPHDGKDRKNWFKVHCPVSIGVEQAIQDMRYMRDMLIKTGYCPNGAISYELVRGGMTLEEFMAEFGKAPFVQKATPEETEKYYPGIAEKVKNGDFRA